MPTWPQTTTAALRRAAEEKRTIQELVRDDLVDHRGKRLDADQILRWWKTHCKYTPASVPRTVKTNEMRARECAAILDRAVAQLKKDDPTFHSHTTWKYSRF